MEDQLNESPISYDEEAQISSEQSQDDEEAQMLQDEPFKGSFLMQMQKLTRPLNFDRLRYNIYSLQYEESFDNILCFIQEEQEEKSFTFDTKNQNLQDYVLDFEDNEKEECNCNCHKKTQHVEYNSTRRNSQNIKGNVGEPRQDIMTFLEKFEQKHRLDQRKSTTISLKDYKQQIKKKLNEKK